MWLVTCIKLGLITILIWFSNIFISSIWGYPGPNLLLFDLVCMVLLYRCINHLKPSFPLYILLKDVLFQRTILVIYNLFRLKLFKE